ncbi:MAG: DUF1289 domain-containing protein [Betaproteobacteria bacterium]|nr:DUF1289 domain-containing protein [Betaproteobacteria bacterium]
MKAAPARVPSPCVQVCEMDETLGLCRGCRRTLKEIADWLEMPAKEQLATLQRAADRKRLLGDHSDISAA